MTASRRRPPADPRQIAMFDLSPTLVRAVVENDAAAEPIHAQAAHRRSERVRKPRKADPFGFDLQGVAVERCYSLDDRPQWVATVDADGKLERLALRLTVPAARKLLDGEPVRFRETAYRRPPQLDLFTQWRSYVVGQVYSIVMILRALGDDPMSGQRRLNLTREVDELLQRYFAEQWELYDEEHAVLMTFKLLAKAPSYPRPEWFEEYIEEWREELLEAFTGNGSRSIFPDWDTP